MADTTDKITDTRNTDRPNTASVASGRAAGGTSLSCDDLTGWPTASKVHFVTYQVDTNSNPISSTQLDCSGIVSGNNINSLTVIDGDDSGNTVGDIVEMLPTSAWGQDLADALTAEHNRNGTHKQTFLDKIWPVGSVYINASSATNPATLLGFGTWSAFGAGKVLVGLDSGDSDFNTVGNTGGEKTHQLTINEMPAHTHNIDANINTGGTNQRAVGNSNATQATFGTSSRGGDAAHNNLQPYIVVYMWRRTA